jgi:hypothetical protein
LNLGFCVFWLLVFAIMIIARDVVRIVVCLCFCLVHTAVVVLFRLKFKRFGRPERPYNANDLVSCSSMMLTLLLLLQCIHSMSFGLLQQSIMDRADHARVLCMAAYCI